MKQFKDNEKFTFKYIFFKYMSFELNQNSETFIKL